MDRYYNICYMVMGNPRETTLSLFQPIFWLSPKKQRSKSFCTVVCVGDIHHCNITPLLGLIDLILEARDLSTRFYHRKVWSDYLIRCIVLCFYLHWYQSILMDIFVFSSCVYFYMYMYILYTWIFVEKKNFQIRSIKIFFLCSLMSFFIS